MPEINVLSKEIAELIAAGEVIERPLSVIKEMIENSVDSGADTITVEIKNGGISYMRITDNGCGILENDVRKAFLRHATSKISCKDDLDKIMTLGFRGEALASIAAVSKVDMLTKTSDEEYGTHYIVEGSEEKLIEKSGCPNGTTIVIRDIFYNVPARLKFLKKDVTEGNSVSAIVSKIALSHPEISFKFIRDNKSDLFTPGDGDLYSAVYAVFGKDFSESMLEVDNTYNGINVLGFVSKPLSSRANRSLQNFFINNRYVKSVTCNVSLEEAYKNSIMTGKFPACVLKIFIPPQMVDVNVHPTKTEVRFSDEKLIFNSVYFAVKNALLKNDSASKMILPSIEKKIDYTVKSHHFKDLNQCEQIKITETALNNDTAQVIKVYAPSISPDNLILASPEPETACGTEKNNYTKNNAIIEYDEDIKEIIIADKDIKTMQNKVEDISAFKHINNDSFTKKEKTEPIIPVESEPDIRIIGEAFKTYVISEINGELIIIDKHAAHERLIFELLKKSECDINTQMLLVPEEILLSDEECAALEENSEEIKRLGFIIEISSQTVVKVNGMPSYLKGIPAGDIILEIAQSFIKCRHDPSPDILDNIYHTIACKSAIKANDNNNLKELTVLVKNVYGNNEVRYCPHGRPVMITLTKNELEKQFKRLV